MKRLFFTLILIICAICVKAQQYVHYADGDGQYVNIRKQPTSNSAIIGRMTSAVDGRLLSTSGNWYKVNWKGIVGWVSANHCVLRSGGNTSNVSNGRISRSSFYAAARSRKLSASELRGYSKSDLRIMRNEIYARHGYIFNDSKLAVHFAVCDWYVPRYTNVDGMLNSYEKYNVQLIKGME